MDAKTLTKHRILFMIQNCPHCRIYKEVIGKYNMRTKLDKQIQIIDCTKFHDYGITEHPLIRVYKKYIQGTYPVMFFDGIKIEGANAKFEIEEYLRVLLQDDYIVKENNPFQFRKDCEYKKMPYQGERLVCN